MYYVKAFTVDKMVTNIVLKKPLKSFCWDEGAH